MENLGNFFSDELKNQWANDNLKIGPVLRLFDNETNPPKFKLWIIVGFDTEMLSCAQIYINSKINTNIFRTIEAQNLHLKLEAENRSYLTHDSYVDCSELEIRRVSEIRALIVEDAERHKGELADEDLADILLKLREAPTIETKIKKKYGII